MRNLEIIRQWNILRELEVAAHGRTIDELAAGCGVSTRTIRRDLDALQQVGFPLTDDRSDAVVRWKLVGHPFRRLAEAGFTLNELAALYLSRTLIESLAGTPFADDLRTAFDKLEHSLSPRLREFLDRFPQVLAAKAEPTKTHEAATDRDTVARLVKAILAHRRLNVTYHSFSSRRIKDYTLEPYRLAYSEGGVYLFAWVPEYREMRTFAVERVKHLEVLEETFQPVEKLPDRPFADSLGTTHGTPERVEIEFLPTIAPYVQERRFHDSQQVTPCADGSVRMTLDVCLDRSLIGWILGFGPFARVVAPSRLAEQILEELEEARDLYAG